MGFFSWQTADIKESINNVSSPDPHDEPVYLLQPDDKPIEETDYEGYGVFGGVDAYAWLAARNLRDEVWALLKSAAPDAADNVIDGAINSIAGYSRVDSWLPDSYLSKANQPLNLFDEIRTLGITTFASNAMFDPDTGERVINGMNGIPFRFDEPIEKYDGKSLNELNAEDFFVIKAVVPEFPLKFSFNKDADYHALPASEECPNQGYFVPERPAAR